MPTTEEITEGCEVRNKNHLIFGEKINGINLKARNIKERKESFSIWRYTYTTTPIHLIPMVLLKRSGHPKFIYIAIRSQFFVEQLRQNKTLTSIDTCETLSNMLWICYGPQFKWMVTGYLVDQPAGPIYYQLLTPLAYY